MMVEVILCKDSRFLPTEPQRVAKVDFVGPPSCAYGQVILSLECGKTLTVRGTGAHRPRKRDVKVIAE